ncbi:urotensin-2B [Enhydra lutris kenyoni]|uniref:Urotensin-2B n=1 Tax=Enhydra lutris kenyoni TaxID=391180 RepID=A0A2Y9JKW1_ENHLU|nr:urotensin-2B [Enhydra lutris kenyoni]
MNKVLSTTLCFGLLTLLTVMSFLELVHGQPYLTQGNETVIIIFPDKEDTNHKELLLALLNKYFDFQRPFNIGMTGGLKSYEKRLCLPHKILNACPELEKLKEQFMEAKDVDISYAIDGPSSSHPSKQACFWKYCV